MEGKQLMCIFAVLAVTMLGVCIFLVIYFQRKERRLLNRIQNMLDGAIGGTFRDVHLDESKLSAIENSMWRYLSDNHFAYGRLSEEKEKIQALITDIAHQTAAPISNITLYSQLLEEWWSADSAARNPEVAEGLAAMREQAGKLDFLVDSLVKLSRLETGIIEVTVRLQSIEPVLAAVWTQFRPKAEAKEIRLIVNHTGEEAVFDLRWTVEAVANVVDNAIKYTPRRGTVTVSVEAYSFFAGIHVEDTGIGIPETEQANIFTRFYRSGEAKDEPGLGIGLYLAREVMKAQNGYIKLNSRVREGSTFTLFLLKEEKIE